MTWRYGSPAQGETPTGTAQNGTGKREKATGTSPKGPGTAKSPPGCRGFKSLRSRKAFQAFSGPLERDL